MPNKRPVLLVLVPAVLLLGAGLLTAQSPALVLWQPLRPLVMESDDWGLAGFVPSDAVWDGVEPDELKPGRFRKSTGEAPWKMPPWSLGLPDHGRSCGRRRFTRGLSAQLCAEPRSPYEEEGDAEVWKRYDLPRFPPDLSPTWHVGAGAPGHGRRPLVPGIPRRLALRPPAKAGEGAFHRSGPPSHAQRRDPFSG